MNKAIFLDRDGTIIEDKRNNSWKGGITFIPRALEGMKKLQMQGYKLIIVTNQSGIGKGYYTEGDYFDLREELHKRLLRNEIFISAEYFCPHHKEGIGRYRQNCNCRKPQTGMLETAANDFSLSLKDCWMIGDKDLDIIAGKNAGCRTIHVATGEHKNIDYADFTARNLIEAADYILGNNNK